VTATNRQDTEYAKRTVKKIKLKIKINKNRQYTDRVTYKCHYVIITVSKSI